MNEIGVYEAKTQLTKLLDRVLKGEVFTITRHGRPLANLIPVSQSKKLSVEEAIQGLIELKKRVNIKVTWSELRKMRDTGRR